MVMLIFSQISVIFWLWEPLLGFCIAAPSGTEGESFSGQANGSAGCPCSISLGAGNAGRGDGMLLCYSARKPVREKLHRDEMGFSEWKRLW